MAEESYPDIFFTPGYQELFKDTAFGGEPCQFTSNGIDYRFYKRPIAGYFDIVSPYGYSGPVAIEDKADWVSFQNAFTHYCYENGIIAEFARLHPYLENSRLVDSRYLNYERDVVYVDLLQDVETIRREYSDGCHSAIKQASKQIEIKILPGVADSFYTLYTERMKAIGVEREYLFSEGFFSRLAQMPGAWTVMAYRNEMSVAGAVLLTCGRFVHYFLSGSIMNEYSKNATNLIIHSAITWAKEVGYEIFNLGGGRRVGDSLWRFKLSFSATTKPFYTYRKIHNQTAYDEICKQRGVNDKGAGFFPAYRRAI